MRERGWEGEGRKKERGRGGEGEGTAFLKCRESIMHAIRAYGGFSKSYSREVQRYKVSS